MPDYTATYDIPYPVAGDAVGSAPAVFREAALIIDRALGASAGGELSRATSAATPNTLARRDSRGGLQVATPSAAADAATKAYVDAAASAKAYVDARTPGARVDTSVGTRVYVGDVMVYADSGVRLMRNCGIRGWKANLRVRRINAAVEIWGYMEGSASTDDVFMDGLPGFSPGSFQLAGYASAGDGSRFTGVITNTNAALTVSNGSRKDYFVRLTFTTTDGWPSSLPGEPA